MLSDAEELVEFCQRARQAPYVALDTEFMRERTYYPELCLIQAALPDEIVLIDPLVVEDLSSLEVVLAAGPDKIMHACRQDQEALATRLQAGLKPVFDTQVAAALCGHPPQWSYAKLVEEFCGVSLAKTATRTDWARRPLNPAQLDYAADDVRYLPQARELLSERLQALGRREWFDQDMRLIEQQDTAVEPAVAWQKVKGCGRLDARALAGVQQLAAWRETQAMQRNLPRRWVLGDEALVAIAQAAPGNRGDLDQLRGALGPADLRRHGEALLKCVALAAEQPATALDGRIPDPARIKRLQLRLRKLAEELAVDASILATRADLSALVLEQPCPNLQQGWRQQVVGDVLAQVA